MPQCTWSAYLDRTRGRKEDGRLGREGWGVKNNLVQAPLVHFVIEVHRERKKNALATILWHFLLIPTTSCSAAVLSVCACLHVHMCTCTCVLVRVATF